MTYVRRRLLTTLVDYIIFLLCQLQKWSTTSALPESKHDRKSMFMSYFFLQLKTVGSGISCEENKNPRRKTEIFYFEDLALQTEKFSQYPLKRKFYFCSERQKVIFKAHYVLSVTLFLFIQTSNETI